KDIWLKSLFVYKPDPGRDSHYYLLATKRKIEQTVKLQFCGVKLGCLNVYDKICQEGFPEIYEASH
ncbi:hypothetical protein DBR06_SOUSAS510143, partial [Sousa chinensis]